MVSGGTVTSDLSSLSSFSNSFTSEINGLSGAWKGASYDNLSSKANSVAEEYLSAIKGQMQAFANACDLYVEYQDTKNKLSSARSAYNSSKDEKKNSSLIHQLETRLQELKSQIEGLLGSASGPALEGSKNSNLNVDPGTTTTGSSADGLTPKWGSFTRQVFTSSTGIQIPYLFYEPDYGKQVTGLPTHMYMTCAGMSSTGEKIMTYGGIGKLLNEKALNPSGYVIVPYVPSGKEYESESFRKALAELPVSVSKEKNGDLNRISLSGHSYGAITAYNLVNENPNTFSAIVPVSGSKPPTNAFKNVKVWAFHGTQDNPGNNTDYRKAVQNVKAIQAMGGDATLHAYSEYPNCYHTHTANYTFSHSFDDPEDEKKEDVSPLEWAFKQVKKTA